MLAPVLRRRGFMMTELPRGWQPIVNSSGRLVRVAKVALDFKGTAYFLSELGVLRREDVGARRV